MRLSASSGVLLLPALSLIATLFPYCVLAALVNITVDDTSDRIDYAPLGAWRDAKCNDHVAQEGCGSAYMGTWHAALPRSATDSKRPATSEAQTATLNFTGTAIYVFCITASLHGTDLTFFLDGDYSGSFSFSQETTRVSRGYNMPVYVNTSLDIGEHIFILHNGQPAADTGGNRMASEVSLDYIAYTTESDDPQIVQPLGADVPNTSVLSIRNLLSSPALPVLTTSCTPFKPPYIEVSQSTPTHPSNRRTILIAVLCSILPPCFLIALCFLLFRRHSAQHLLHRAIRARPRVDRGHVYQGTSVPDAVQAENEGHNKMKDKPQEILRDIGVALSQVGAAHHHSRHAPHLRTSISEDPALSGWAHGTWGESPNLPHPSLKNVSEGTAGMRGDLLVRGASRVSRGREKRGQRLELDPQPELDLDFPQGIGGSNSVAGRYNTIPGLTAEEGVCSEEYARAVGTEANVVRLPDIITPLAGVSASTPRHGSTAESRPLQRHPYSAGAQLATDDGIIGEHRLAAGVQTRPLRPLPVPNCQYPRSLATRGFQTPRSASNSEMPLALISYPTLPPTAILEFNPPPTTHSSMMSSIQSARPRVIRPLPQPIWSPIQSSPVRAVITMESQSAVARLDVAPRAVRFDVLPPPYHDGGRPEDAVAHEGGV